MKTLKLLIPASVLSLFIYSCINRPKPENNASKDCLASSEVVMLHYRFDTINKTDCDGKKQGLWIIGPYHRKDSSSRIDTFFYKDDIQIKKPSK